MVVYHVCMALFWRVLIVRLDPLILPGFTSITRLRYGDLPPHICTTLDQNALRFISLSWYPRVPILSTASDPILSDDAATAARRVLTARVAAFTDEERQEALVKRPTS